MSDSGIPDPAAPAAPAAPAGDPPAPVGFDGMEGEYDRFLAGEGDTIQIPRSQLQHMAKEHKDYRQKWGGVARTVQVDTERVTAALDGLIPEDQGFFFDFLAGIRSNDPTAKARAAASMRAVLDDLSPAEQKKMEKAIEAAGEDPDEFDPLDPEQFDQRVETRVQKLMADRDAKANQDQAVAAQVEKIRTLAKEMETEHEIPGLGDPTDDVYQWLLSTARTRFASTKDPLEAIRQAAGHIRESLDKRAQSMLQAKKGAAGAGPATPPGGVEPSGRKVPQTMAEAKQAATDRLALLDRQAGT